MSDSRFSPAGTAGRDDTSPVPFTRVYRSSQSAFGEPVELVVRSPAEWQRAWAGAHPNRAAALPELPAVDFGAATVVVVAAGTQPNGGVSVQVDSVRERAGGGTDVFYTVIRPGAGCMSTQQLTAPVEAVRIARRPGEVVFIRRDRAVPC